MSSKEKGGELRFSGLGGCPDKGVGLEYGLIRPALIYALPKLHHYNFENWKQTATTRKNMVGPGGLEPPTKGL